MENKKINLPEVAKLFLPYRNSTGIDVGDVMRSLGSNNNNSKDIETMFETGTGLAGASTVHDMQRQTRVRRSDTRNNTNYHYTDSPHDYDWDNTDAQAIMYNRYLAIQRSSLVIRLLLFAVLILLIVKIVKK